MISHFDLIGSNVMLYVITNVKVSIKTSFFGLNTVDEVLLHKTFKRYSNFIVYREKYTYIIFKSGKSSTNHINVTKIKRLEDVDEAIKHITCLLRVEELKRTIDNITVSINLQKKINLLALPHFKESISTSFNPEKFPGVFVKFTYGTIILFHTGKCILIGVKTISDIECLTSKLVVI
jgi:TATA-box binding protein (TBP) (component of TFIID and TFIIIB)